MQTTSANVRPWYSEWQFWALAAFVLAVYFSRLTALPLRGEEFRWAMVAREMMETGDWIVPRQQGAAFLSRPPLSNYEIAWCAMLLGELSPLAIRLPTAIATLLTTLMIYGYARQFLARTGALAAALFFATMGQVLQLGQLAETEATFTLLVTASLLLWHWGYAKAWSPYFYWSLAYLCVGLGALAKGPQAPVYFASTIGVFLLYWRQWRQLFHPAHFVGIGVFAVVLSAWQVPFAMQLGWNGVRDIWTDDVGLRFVGQNWLDWMVHLVTFPTELAIALLPGSLLLLAYLRPSFWRGLLLYKGWLSFLLIAIITTFPSCWLVPAARTRYYMPLYPCFALLMGLVVQRLLDAQPAAWLKWLWVQYRRLTCVLGIGLAVVALALGLWPTKLPMEQFRQPALFAVTLASIALALVVWIYRHRGERDAVSEPVVNKTLWGGSLLFGFLCYTCLGINLNLQNGEDISDEVLRLKTELPPGVKVVSFGHVMSSFTYYYGEPIGLLPFPTTATEVPTDVEYFVVNGPTGSPPDLPFEWEEVRVLSAERVKREVPQQIIVVGRIVHDTTPNVARKTSDSSSSR